MNANKWKQGDIHPETGLVYWSKQASCKNGERWMTQEKYLAKIEMIRAYVASEAGRAAIAKRRNAEAERKKRNEYAKVWGKSDKRRALAAGYARRRRAENHLAAIAGDMLWFYLIAAPVAGRSLLVLLMYRQTYARENGLGNVFIGKVTARQTVITLLMGAVLVASLGQITAIRAWLITLIFVFGYQRFIHKRLGGQTGDTLGAGNELFEVFFLLMLF